VTTSNIPTADQVFGALNALFKLRAKQEPRAPDKEEMSLGAHLGHEPRGVLTTLHLWGASLEAYREFKAQLWAATHWGRRGGYNEVVKLANRFLLEMGQDPGTGHATIKRDYSERFRAKLGHGKRTWKVVARVPALLQGTHDARLVGIRFRSMTGPQMAAIKRELTRDLRRKGASKLDPMETSGFQYLNGRDVTATVFIEASDVDTAQILADELIDDRLDCLAGVLALTRDPKEGKTDPRRRAGPRLAIDSVTGSARGAFAGLDSADVELTRLVESRRAAQVIVLLRLIERGPRKSGERRLLNAIRWLGRSHRARSEVEAYVNGAVAYETLLAGRSEAGISYTLRLRSAQLLGRTRDVRRRLLRTTQDFYSVRSEIVHGTRHGVQLDELIEFWRLLNRVILAYMKRGFHRRSIDEIDRWFEDQVL
jgi:hypothetical protein